MSKIRFAIRAQRNRNADTPIPIAKAGRLNGRETPKSNNFTNGISAFAAVCSLAVSIATFQTGESIKSVKIQLSKDLVEKEQSLRAEIDKREAAIGDLNEEITNKEDKLTDQEIQLRSAFLQNAQIQAQSVLAQGKLIDSNSKLSAEQKAMLLAQIERTQILSDAKTLQIANQTLQLENRSLQNDNETAKQYVKTVLALAVDEMFSQSDQAATQLLNNAEDMIDTSVNVRALVFQDLERIGLSAPNPMTPRILSALNTYCQKVPSEIFKFGPATSDSEDSPKETRYERETKEGVAFVTRRALDDRQKAIRASSKLQPAGEMTKQIVIGPVNPEDGSERKFGPPKSERYYSLRDIEIMDINFPVNPNWNQLQSQRFHRVEREVRATGQRLKSCIEQQLGIAKAASSED